MRPRVLRDNNIKIWASNLCSEICLPSNEDESFVCNLASMNLLTYDEWKDTDAVETMIYFLDAVMEEYIEKTQGIPFMESAYNFALRWRALGLGQLGWHSYLQASMIPFESFEAHLKATEISKFIDERAKLASQELAEEYGRTRRYARIWYAQSYYLCYCSYYKLIIYSRSSIDHLLNH